MGNVNTAFQDSIQTNVSNPAALSNKYFTSIDFGLNLNYKSQQDQTNSTSFTEGGVSYLSYSFPVNQSRTWGMGLGVQPLTYKGYDVTSDVVNNLYVNEFEGEGNTYKLFLQNGVEVFDGLSLGLDAGILFGRLEDKTYNTYVLSTAISSGQIVQQKLRGFVFKLGGQYTTELSDDLNLTIGTTYGLESELTNDITIEDVTYTVASSEVSENGKLNVITRAIQNTDTRTIESEITYPQTAGFGAYVNKDEKWSLGIDAKYGNWNNFQGLNDDESQSYKNSIDLGIGGSFIPNYRNPRKAFESFEYRYGGFYNQSFLTIANTDIQDYGITLGVGLPVKRDIPGSRIRQIPSSVDLGVAIGQTGTIDNNLVQDSYIKGTVGLSLNDIWFQKKKYD